MDNKTSIFNVKELRQELILITLNEVVTSLEDAGYNPTSQLVGYLINNDDAYITNYQNARKKLRKFNRSEVLMALINGYLGR